MVLYVDSSKKVKISSETDTETPKDTKPLRSDSISSRHPTIDAQAVQTTTMIAAEYHLLRRQFQQAQTTAHAALLNLQPPTSPFGIVTATTTTTPTKPQGMVSLRPFPEQHTVSPSSFSHLEELVRLCAVWMQATAELQHLDNPNPIYPTPPPPHHPRNQCWEEVVSSRAKPDN